MGRILLGFFIPHWDLPYAQSLNSKTIYQLDGFPRELFESSLCIRFNMKGEE